jgi:hypothetical protein
VPCNPGHISNLRSGKSQPSPELAEALDERLEAGGALRALTPDRAPGRHRLIPARDNGAIADEIAALDLIRQAEATQVGSGTVERLELAVDDLATAYPSTPSAVLLDRVHSYLGYVSRLLDAKTTLAEHHCLLVVGGWMSLLAATTLIDLHRDRAAAAHLRTAAQLARETGHTEIAAWCLETQAWQVLTAGDYRLAADISQAAQRIAPKSGSAFIQATAQEGRAWARLGDSGETRAVLGRVEVLVSPLPVPDRPEHHYRYDPPKAQYSSTRPTTLAAAAAARATVVQAEGSLSAWTWRRITATTRSTTTASAIGATAYAATDRGLATSAADTFMYDAAAHARIRARSARADWPARDRPSASGVNTIISRSRSSASITLAAPWRRTARR